MDEHRSNGQGMSYDFRGVDKFMDDLKKLKPTRKERSNIVEKAVPVVSHTIAEHAPHHFHYPSQDKWKGYQRNPHHLNDPNAVVHKRNQYLDGGTDVGYNYINSIIARFIDHGTWKDTGQFFMEHAFQNIDKGEVFRREQKQLNRELDQKLNNNDN